MPTPRSRRRRRLRRSTRQSDRHQGEAKAIKELVAAIKASDEAESAQSDLNDDEIADEIANIFEEAGIELSKKGQATLDKMRADANDDGKVSRRRGPRSKFRRHG